MGILSSFDKPYKNNNDNMDKSDRINVIYYHF